MGKRGRRPNLERKDYMKPLELAYMLQINDRTIRKWCTAGHLRTALNKMYIAKEVFDTALEKDVSASDKDRSKPTAADIQVARARYERAKAKCAECEVGIEKQELLLEEDVVSHLVHLFIVVKRELMTMPRVLPNALYGMNEKEVEELVQSRLSKIYDMILDETEIKFLLKKIRKNSNK